MPTFENNPLENLQFSPGDADEEINLQELAYDDALEQVSRLLSSGVSGRSYCLRFSPAKGDGTETLFQPLGRLLLEARKNSVLSRFLPISSGTGYFIAFK